MAYGRPRPLALVRIFLIIAFVALLIYGYVADWRPHDLDDIRKSAERLGSTAPFVAVIAQAVGVVFLIPGFLLIIATALLFGNASIWISILGQGLGATLCYLVGRTLGHDFVRAMLGPRMITIEALLEEHAFRYLLYLHFLWLIPLPLVTYGGHRQSKSLRNPIVNIRPQQLNHLAGPLNVRTARPKGLNSPSPSF